MHFSRTLGAIYLGENRCEFRVWAPSVPKVEIHILEPEERILPMERLERGYHRVVVEGAKPGTRYFYCLAGQKERPDPASQFQPKGVHGPSEVVDPVFPWEDSSWCGIPLREYVIYELHVGTFTDEGTFDAILPFLDPLKELGITAIELMPVAQFPGERNWGYDGVYPFAVQNSYGGPEGLKRLVNACHQRKLAVILDVVYNHLGPEGNYLADYGPYFSERYRTAWGKAINFDGPHSDEVRRYFIENALTWVEEYHVDALRLDAVHAILDHTPQPFLQELAQAVHEVAERLNRKIYLFAETSANDARVLRPPCLGGYGLDAQWNDDFHHALHTLLTGEDQGYYQDYGSIGQLAKAFRNGYVYTGEYSRYRQRRHGSSCMDIPAERMVVFAQNHDQVGNRACGERLSSLVTFEALKVAAGLVLLSPFLPLLFMGEEYGEVAPFPYFVSHSDPDLVEAVRRGRREEFASFRWTGEIPDPQDKSTFLRAKLNHDLAHQGRHRILREFYKTLLRLRKEMPPLACLSKNHLEVVGYESTKVLLLRRWTEAQEVAIVTHLGEGVVRATLPVPPGTWQKRLDSAEERWAGPGSFFEESLPSQGEISVLLQPWCLILLQKET